MQILDKQFLADHIVEDFDEWADEGLGIKREEVEKIVGDIEAIDKLLPGWLRFHCSGCYTFKTEGLKFKAGTCICMDCMTEPYDTMTGTINDSIKLVSGHYISLKNPDPNLIYMEDISSGVSNISRYSGQLNVERWYSVAEHLLNCWELAKQLHYTTEQQRHILMHDASEAYLGDMSKPLKRMMPMFKWFEHKIEKAIETRYDLNFKKHHDAIKIVDNALLLAERFAIYGDDGVEWLNQAEIMKVQINPKYLKPMDIKVEFLTAWRSLH